MRISRDAFRNLFGQRMSSDNTVPAHIPGPNPLIGNSTVDANSNQWSITDNKWESATTERRRGDGRYSHEVGPQPGDTIRLRLLVIATEAADPNLKAITTVLDYIGVPYDTLIAEKSTLTATRLWKGSYCRYQGLILTANRLQYWNRAVVERESVLSSNEWRILRQFRSRFGIRQVSLFCAPGESDEDTGLRLNAYADTSSEPLQAYLTESGSEVFWYLNPASSIPVQSVPAYLAEPASDSTVPLLVTTDDQSMATISRDKSGLEDLMLTMAHSADLLHTLLLGYGIVNWVARGLFLGSRNVCLSIQVDDIFNYARLRHPDADTSGEDGELFRLDKTDVKALVGWLRKSRHARLVSPSFTLDLAFNGGGVSADPEEDSLVQSLVKYQDCFRWINHGYSHLHLDDADENVTRSEIVENHRIAEQLGLAGYSSECMVTSETSGLTNDRFLATAHDLGIRYVVSDTSQSEWDNPTPNAGNPCPGCPHILAVPRHPNNLLHDVSTPEEWESRYNDIYRDYWGRDLDLDGILEQESSVILRYLLKFDTDPLMFHQANLRAYDGTHSLLTDLIDRVLDKYMSYYRDVPVVSLSMHETGQRMERRAAYDSAQILACLVVDDGLLLSAHRDVIVPITGVRGPDEGESYGGQDIAMVSLKQGEATRIPSHRLMAYGD